MPNEDRARQLANTMLKYEPDELFAHVISELITLNSACMLNLAEVKDDVEGHAVNARTVNGVQITARCHEMMTDMLRAAELYLQYRN
jgi:hypothetical protein